MSDNINMYKTLISQLTEDDANLYSICHKCKKLTHIMNKSIQGYINHCSMKGFGMSDSTIASGCIECYIDRTKEIKRDDNRKRNIFLESYLEKKGDPKYIKIDESNHQSKCQDQNAGLDGSL